MELPPRPRTTTLWAAVFFAVSGLLAFVNDAVPTDGVSQARVALLGGADLTIAALLWLLPWQRWHPRSSLLLIFPGALGIICGFKSVGAMPAYGMPVFLLLVFFWIGLSQPPFTALLLAPLALAPCAWLLHHNGDHAALHSIVIALPVSTAIAETLARVLRQLATAQAAQRRQLRLLSIMLRAANTMAELEGELVFASAVDALIALGADVALLALLDDSGKQYRYVASQGLPELLTNESYDASGGMIAMISQTERATVVDCATHPETPAHLRSLHSGIVVPIWRDGRIAGALAGFRQQAWRPSEDELAAIELVAHQTERSFSNAQRFATELERARVAQEESLLDPLSGVGNRRFVDQLIAQLLPGDAILMLDLDHFKRINDSAGHAAGDAVLSQLGAFLSSHLRASDAVGRYGGEEFLVVFREAGHQCEAAAERLLEAWRALSPPTTLSGGIATHLAGRSASDSVAAADRALYQAKRSGRDRVCAEPALQWNAPSRRPLAAGAES